MADANEVMALFNEIYTNIDQTNVQAANKTGTGKFVLQNSPTINSPIFISPIGVGPVSFTPTYTLDVRSNSSASQIHVSRNSGDVGGWLTQVANDSTFDFSAGAAYDGTNWVAKATTAAIWELNAGNAYFTSDSGLVVGNTFAPTGRLYLRANGDLWLNATAKLFLDGGSNTYLYEASPDTVHVAAGGALALAIGTAGIGVPATNRVYLDGGSDTSIRESAADTITFQTNGVDQWSMGSTGTMTYASTGRALNVSTTGTPTSVVNINADGAVSAGLTVSSSTATNAANFTQSGNSTTVAITNTSNTATNSVTLSRNGNSASDVFGLALTSVTNTGAGNAIKINLTNTGGNVYAFQFDVDATDPTGGGGAATGRIPVLIGGVTRYLAYY